jgi:hypothetical protein
MIRSGTESVVKLVVLGTVSMEKQAGLGAECGAHRPEEKTTHT